VITRTELVYWVNVQLIFGPNLNLKESPGGGEYANFGLLHIASSWRSVVRKESGVKTKSATFAYARRWVMV
jgi:hypothetical protein